MSAAMVDQNPDYSYRMNSQRPYSPQQHYHQDPDIRTSAYVSDSDLQYADRQERIRGEMKREYEDHVRRPSPGYRDTEPPRHQRGVPQKEELENRRREELYRRRSQSPAKPQTELYDHNEMAQQLREERRREYNDLMRRKDELQKLYPRKLATPPGGGLPIGGYDDYRKRLRADRTREYRDSLLQQQKQQWFQRAQEYQLDTSPIHEGHLQAERPLVGSPRDVIIDYKKLKQEVGEDRKTDYTKNLTQQQKEQILNKVQHQPEIQVLDRRNQQPPPQHDMRRSQDSQRYRAPSPRWEPEMYKRETFAPDQQQNPMAKPSIQEMGKPSIQEMGKPYIQETGFGSEEQKSTKVPQRMDEDFQNLWYGNYKREPFRKASPRLLSPPHQANIGNEEEYHSTRRKKEHEDRRKEYNDFLQMKKETENEKKMQIEKQRNQPPAQIIKGDYYSSEQYDKRRQQLHDQEHREYQKFLERPQGTREKVQKRVNDYNKHWQFDGIDMDKVKIFPQGEYQEKHKHLQKQWKDSFKDLMAQQRETLIKEHEVREQGKHQLENAVVESPRCIPTGNYEIKQQEFKDQLREECRSFLKRHVPKERSKDIWKENDMHIRTVPQSGEYKNRRERLQHQLRQDFLDFYGQQTPRTDRTNRKKEYSNDPPGAVLFDGEYKRVKEKVREERTRDYHTYLEKKQQEFSRKSGDFGEGNNTFFNNLGHSMDQRKEQLIKERNDDYRRHLQDDQPRYQSPPRDDRRSRPNSYQNGPQTPSYQDMLQDKRRQEDSYRRYADPEYNARPGDRY